MTDELVRAPRRPDPDWVGDTYKYVRLITPVPAIWLLLSILVVALIRGRFLDSISDYYGGPLRDVFVGALLASAVGMIAYKGHSSLEDHALNFAGVNAMLVALVPNSFQSLLDGTRASEAKGAPVLVSSAELLENLRIGVGVLLVTLAIFVVVDAALMHWTDFRATGQTLLTRRLLCISWLGEAALFVIVTATVLGRTTVGSWSIFSTVHFTAATLLIINLSFAAASHAFPGKLRSETDGPPASAGVQTAFTVITVVMWLGLLGGAALILGGVPYAVIGVEVFEILLFLVFWFLATRNEWRKLGAVGGS